MTATIESTASAKPRKVVRRSVVRRQRTRLVRVVLIFAALLAGWLALWQAAVSLELVSTMVPSPAQTWDRLSQVLSRPAYSDGINSVGIVWHLLASLRRVLIGFALAALVAIPVGFVLATARSFGAAADPFIQVLRPVSPLAWLPIGLAVFQSSELTALFVIFMSALWPILLNTIAAVRGVDPAYLDLARTLEADRVTVARRILLPAALPTIVTGLRVSVGVAWLVIIAAEMLVGGRGMGYFVWNEWNNLNVASILVAILLIGIVGLVLDRMISALERVVRYD